MLVGPRLALPGILVLLVFCLVFEGVGIFCGFLALEVKRL
jgi:hypothetical protein